MSLYQIYAVKIGSTVIPVTGSELDHRIEAWIGGDASQFVPTAIAVNSMIPVARFTSEALLSVLAVVNVNPVRVTSGATMIIYYGKRGAGASWSSAADSGAITVNEGMVSVTQVTGGSGPANVSVEVTAAYDGTNFPLVLSAVDLDNVTVTAIANYYGLFGVAYNSSSVRTFVPVTSATVQIGHETISPLQAASPYTANAHVGHTSGSIQISTDAIKTAIDLITLDGLTLATLDSTDLTNGTSIEVYFGKMDKGGSFASGSNHIVFKAYNGLMVIDQFSADNDQVASLDAQMYPISQYDANAGAYIAPLGYAAAVALPTVAALSATWTNGPVAANSVAWQAKNTSVQMNNKVTRIGCAGTSHDTSVLLDEVAPTVTISTYDPIESLIGLGDSPATPGKQLTNCVFYFRKNASGSNRVAAATAEHIAFTLYDCHAMAESQSLSSRTVGEGNVKFTAIKSGVNAVASVDTTAAIA